MEQQYILTPAEADVLSNISNDNEASIYEITTAVRLTPSEAVDVVRRLRDRNLVELVQDNRLAKLTAEGRYVRAQIQRQERRPFSSGQDATHVVIVSGDESMGASRKAFEELAPEELDSALDSELEKLEQEAGAGQT